MRTGELCPLTVISLMPKSNCQLHIFVGRSHKIHFNYEYMYYSFERIDVEFTL